MIGFIADPLRAYSNQSVFGLFTEGVPALINTLVQTISHVARNILLQLLISVPLFYLHHNLFAVGFLTGFILDKQVRDLVNRVDIVYNGQRSLLERVLFFGGGGFLAVLTMPTSMIIATLYYSAKWGESLYRNSYERNQQDRLEAIEIQ